VADQLSTKGGRPSDRLGLAFELEKAYEQVWQAVIDFIDEHPKATYAEVYSEIYEQVCRKLYGEGWWYDLRRYLMGVVSYEVWRLCLTRESNERLDEGNHPVKVEIEQPTA
jgi:hypothetical protein